MCHLLPPQSQHSPGGFGCKLCDRWALPMETQVFSAHQPRLEFAPNCAAWTCGNVWNLMAHQEDKHGKRIKTHDLGVVSRNSYQPSFNNSFSPMLGCFAAWVSLGRSKRNWRSAAMTRHSNLPHKCIKLNIPNLPMSPFEVCRVLCPLFELVSSSDWPPCWRLKWLKHAFFRSLWGNGTNMYQLGADFYQLQGLFVSRIPFSMRHLGWSLPGPLLHLGGGNWYHLAAHILSTYGILWVISWQSTHSDLVWPGPQAICSHFHHLDGPPLLPQDWSEWTLRRLCDAGLRTCSTLQRLLDKALSWNADCRKSLIYPYIFIFFYISLYNSERILHFRRVWLPAANIFAGFLAPVSGLPHLWWVWLAPSAANCHDFPGCDSWADDGERHLFRPGYLAGGTALEFQLGRLKRRMCTKHYCAPNVHQYAASSCTFAEIHAIHHIPSLSITPSISIFISLWNPKPWTVSHMRSDAGTPAIPFQTHRRPMRLSSVAPKKTEWRRSGVIGVVIAFG